AVRLRAIAELAVRDPSADPGTIVYTSDPGPFNGQELRPALVMSRRAAADECCYALTVVRDLPLVFAALAAGEVDPARVRVVHRYLVGLDSKLVEKVCRQLVPKAAGWTTGELRGHLARLIVALDPQRAEEQYRRSLRERGVAAYPNDDGTITVSAHN